MVIIVEMDNNVAQRAQLEEDVGPSFIFTNLQKLHLVKIKPLLIS
ncbi:MAG: hypothetical protein WCF14_12240 [Nitrososphaeraceae archaeon]